MWCVAIPDPIDLGCDPGLTATALAWVNVPEDPSALILLKRVVIVKASTGAGPATMVRQIGVHSHGEDWFRDGRIRSVTAESQTVHAKRGSHSRRDGGVGRVDPGVLIGLAHVSGAVAALADCDDVAFPTPQEWKGNLDKVVYHEAVLLALGGEAEGWGWYVDGSAKAPRLEPRNPPVGRGLPGTAWVHLLDAVGLVLWKTRGKQWRRDTLGRSTDPVMAKRRKWAARAAELPDGDGLLRP